MKRRESARPETAPPDGSGPLARAPHSFHRLEELVGRSGETVKVSVINTGPRARGSKPRQPPPRRPCRPTAARSLRHRGWADGPGQVHADGAQRRCSSQLTAGHQLRNDRVPGGDRERRSAAQRDLHTPSGRALPHWSQIRRRHVATSHPCLRSTMLKEATAWSPPGPPPMTMATRTLRPTRSRAARRGLR
jgi:hypothetical protein